MGRRLGGGWEDPGEDFGKNSGKDDGTTVELITVVFNDVKRQEKSKLACGSRHDTEFDRK
jgi:hypothetical protein